MRAGKGRGWEVTATGNEVQMLSVQLRGLGDSFSLPESQRPSPHSGKKSLCKCNEIIQVNVKRSSDQAQTQASHQSWFPPFFHVCDRDHDPACVMLPLTVGSGVRLLGSNPWSASW